MFAVRREGVALSQSKRIAIVGCIGAGKSTLARILGERLGLDVFHLDRMWWQGGGYRIVGTETVATHTMNDQAFRNLQEELAARDSWIIDGGRADLSRSSSEGRHGHLPRPTEANVHVEDRQANGTATGRLPA
jgi:hypothetical protein